MRWTMSLFLAIFVFPAPLLAGEKKAEAKITDLGTRQSGVDWPHFLGPNGDSTSPEKGILAPWPKKGLREVWAKEVGIGYAGPAISKGRLFFFDRHNNKARLSCMNAESGKELWRFEYATNYEDKYGYNSGPRCCPIVDGDRVYIFGVDGMLHCVNFEGKEVWKVDTAKKFNVIQNFFGVSSVPIIEGDLLIVHIGGCSKDSSVEEFLDIKGNGSGVVAFNKYTGKVVYSITDELASYASPVLATINGRRWCFVFARGGLIGFNPANGKIDFHYPYRSKLFESVNAANPVVVGDKVLISETYGPGAALLQVKPGGYKVLWTDADKRPREKSMMCHWATPVHHDGYLYGCSGRHDYNAELRCIELATGKVTWSKPDLARTSLLKVDDHFLGLSEYGYLFLFKINPKKFEPISIMSVRDPAKAEQPVRDEFWFAPVLSHGLLYIKGDNRLVCLELIPAKK